LISAKSDWDYHFRREVILDIGWAEEARWIWQDLFQETIGFEQ